MNTSDKELYSSARGDEDIAGPSFYRFVIDSLPTAVLTVNADLKITGFNPWAEHLTGYRAAEAIGHYCGDILKGGMCEARCPLRTVLKGHKPLSLVETTVQDKWGENIPVRMNTAGLFDDLGKLIGGVESFQDISRLKILEREKTHLISMFAHDMKSSLSIIGGFALRLLKEPIILDDQKTGKYIDVIRKESLKLECLVDDFLEFSRLQTGKLKFDFGPSFLDKELMELVEAYQVKASESEIHLELQNEEALPIIHADANRLRRVFTNLLDNALKFSRKGGNITIRTQENEDDVTITIKDEGAGIDNSDLPFIFDSFFRGDGAGEKAGFGLGLAGVKAIVEGHGGRVFVDSEVGKGSVFTVVLPKSGKAKGRRRKEQKE
jgi:two-component system phosphate regulon sensor histidine kinase PhoR